MMSNESNLPSIMKISFRILLQPIVYLIVWEIFLVHINQRIFTGKTSGMLDGHRTGDVLMTVATGPLSKEECERTGLVECHAYAVSFYLLLWHWSHLADHVLYKYIC